VFRRYIDQLIGRVSGMGGDPAKVGPTGDGDWQRPGGHDEDDHDHDHDHDRGRELLVGKVCGLTYDRFGDFTGFDIETAECRRYQVCCTEQRVEQLARTAWRERSTVTVLRTGERDCCLVRITVGGPGCCPE
jgi:hypothetical protein